MLVKGKHFGNLHLIVTTIIYYVVFKFSSWHDTKKTYFFRDFVNSRKVHPLLCT